MLLMEPGPSSSLTRCCRSPQPVVDCLSKSFVENRRKGDHGGAAGVSLLHVVEKIGGRFREIAARAEVQHDRRLLGPCHSVRTESNQRFTGFQCRGFEPDGCARRVM